jgi:hypothetical protein
MARADITLTAVDDTRNAFEGVRRNLTGLEGTARSVNRVLAGIGAGLSAAALVGFVRSSVDAADSLGKLSQRVGVTVESLSELQYAGKLADVSTEQLGDGLRKLSVNLQAGAKGSKEFVQAFQLVGITAAELNTLQPDQALARIAEAFAGLEDGAAKTALAVRLFGRSGSDLIPLLNGGASGLRAAGDEARRFGLVVSTDSARAAEQFNDNLTRLGASSQGFGIALAQSVLPALNQIASGMAETAREGGALLGVLRGIAELGKIALQFGPDRTAIEEQRKFILSIRGELARLEGSAAGKGALGTGLLDRLIFGSGADKQRKIAELKITLRDAERALLNLQSQAADKKPQQRGTLPDVVVTGAKVEAELSDGAERGARIFTQIYLDQFKRLREQAKEIQIGLMEVFEAGNEADAKNLKDRADALARILGDTRSGKEAAILKDLQTLNEELILTNINGDQFEEAYQRIQERLNEVRGVGKDTFSALADDGSQAFRDLQFAVEGWGRDFTNTLANALETGRLNFSELIQSVLRDLVRLQIQQSITRPLFNELSRALGNVSLFGGSSSGPGIGDGAGQGLRLPGRANGGPVTANTMYMVGERGPELFVPNNAGTIIPNGAGGGLTQVFNIAPGTDAGTVYRAAAMGAAMAKSDIARGMRIGEMG